MSNAKEEHERNVEKIIETSDKLIREVARLRADVVNLYGRIEPFEGEQLREHYPVTPAKIKKAADAVNAIDEARQSIQKLSMI